LPPVYPGLQLKGNRIVNLDRQGQRPLSAVEIRSTGTVVYLKGYGLIKVFKIVAPDGDIEFWATNDLEMDELTRLRLTENAAMIEPIIAASSSSVASNELKSASPGLSATISAWFCELSCALSTTASTQAIHD
jgi:hypothetical protein